MTIQTVLTPIYQIQFDNTSKALQAAYLRSDDGIVIADLPDQRQAPLILLNRVHTFPPVYNPWLQRSLRLHRAFLADSTSIPSAEAVAAQPSLTLLPPRVAAIIDSLAMAPDAPIELPGATILPTSHNPGSHKRYEGTFPYPIQYRGVKVILHIPIPPGSRPWNEYLDPERQK